MEKIKRFINCSVPVNTCTLRCHYCYITQTGKFSEKLPVLKYPAARLRDKNRHFTQKRRTGKLFHRRRSHQIHSGKYKSQHQRVRGCPHEAGGFLTP